MTICNMSIEGGARVGYVNPDETTFAYLRGPAVRAAGRRVRARGRRGGARSRRTPTRVYDDRVDDRRGGDRADGDLGHQPGPVGRRRRADCRCRRRPADRGSARVHGLRRRAAASRARRSTWRSSARAPTAGCRISRSRARSSRGHHVAPHVQGAGRAGLAGGAAARPKREGLDEIFTRRRLRVARRRLLDVPGDEPRQARGPRRSARRRRTATSRDARAARPAARC